MARFRTLARPSPQPPRRRLRRGRAPSVAAPAGRAQRLIEDLQAIRAELELQNQALRYSQAAAEGASERFVTLFSNAPLAVMVVDALGQILEVNARALALLRPQETDAPLNYLQPLVLPQHLPRVEDAFARAHAEPTVEVSEVEFAGGSNGTIVGDLHVARIETPADEPQSFICAIIDQGPLLAQRAALQASADALRQRNLDLQESQALLAGIIDSSLDAIIGVDAELRVVVFNPAAAKLFGWSAAEALGQPLQRFVQLGLEALPAVAGQHALGECSGRHRNGTALPLEVGLSVQPQGGRLTGTLFVHDLTGRRRMEAQRLELERQLRESQKMQAIGTLAGGIAHDFNNIISAILGNVALAQSAAPGDAGSDPTGQCLAEIDKAARRARNLVRQILTFARNDPPRRAPLNLADVVRDTTALLRVALPPQVRLQLQLPAQVSPVLADATQMEQVLLNLCTNAIQALGEAGGTLGVEVSQPEPTQVVLTVRDDGPGMPPEVRERVFEPFFTTKPVGQGTGLGLSVVHGIVQAHEAQVRVRSAPGQGSAFSITFKALAPENHSPNALIFENNAPPPGSAPERGCGQHVVYVDDDEALVFLVRRLLLRQGYRVTTFSDPRQACRQLCDERLPCDVLVTDHNMPGFSGVDLLQAVHQARPELPLALASGYVTPEIDTAARAAGAQALIHKPNDVDELCSAIHRLLHPQR